MKVNLYPEECCELCGEIIHNHFDCPVCLKKWASTDFYGDMYEELAFMKNKKENRFLEVGCEECGANFKVRNGEDGEYDWELIKVAAKGEKK